MTLCVINHEGEDELDETLATALAEVPAIGEVLLVDNASRDSSLEVAARHPRVRVIRREVNDGPGGARNAGYRAASHDWILFLDNDVTLEPGCVDRLQAALTERPEAVVAMPCVVYAHAPDTVQYDGAEGHFTGLMTLRGAGRRVDPEPKAPHPIGSIVSACFLLDRRRWRGGAPFDESFFIYFEDHDFGLRARAMGAEILSVPAARCRHRSGTAGLSLRRTGRYAELRVFCSIRNRWQLIAKNYEASTLLRLLPLLACYELCQLVGVLKKGWFAHWLAAARWMVSHRREVLAKRREVQAMRVRSDVELLSGGPLPFADQLVRDPIDRLGRHVLDRLLRLAAAGFAPRSRELGR